MIQEATVGVLSGFYLMGGAVPESTDQMNSLGPLRRDAAFARTSLATTPELYKTFYDLVWRDMDLTAGSDFPGINCHNHASNENMGPLKEDWSIPCPGILEMSQEEREEKCVSQAESFWGTANVAKLEEIKRAVDPDELFICNAGIGASSPYIGHGVEDSEGEPATVVNGEVSQQTTTAATTATTETMAKATEAATTAAGTTTAASEATAATTEATTSSSNGKGSDPVDDAKDKNTGSPASIYFYSKGVTISFILAMSFVF